MRIINTAKDDIKTVMNTLKERASGGSPEIERTVAQILEDVKNRGDEALFEYTAKFDGAALDADSIRVSEAELTEAVAHTDPELLKVMERAAERIREYHEKQVRQSFFDTKEDGSILGQRITPIERAGVYVPGGKTAYPSSTLMNIIPAKVAGVKDICVCTPPGKDGKISPVILAAARVAGATEIYKAGGAQAIAAMAFGTQSIKKTDKIVGPGNIFVALAKKAVYGNVSIDSVAGPSEVCVLADGDANPLYAASDLLSQAEHDQMASAILVTTDTDLASKTAEQIDALMEQLPRQEIMKKSVDDYGFIIVTKDMDEAYEVVNSIAPEHLEILTKDPWENMTHIKHAGAIFLGQYSCEPLGDYMAGPNHVLPTNGTARFFSPLSVDDFIKKSSVIAFSKQGLAALHEDIEMFARSEGLFAHENSVAVRFKE